MSNPLEEVKELLAKASGTSRKELLIQLQELIASVETPQETAIRIAFYPLQTSIAKIGQDLKVFETLTNSGPKSLEELQASIKTHPTTLGRLIRYMASANLIREVGTNQFEVNKACQNLATPEAVAIVTNFFYYGTPIFQEIPTFMRCNNYQDVTDDNATVFQSAFKTEKEPYEWISQNPEPMTALSRFMELEQATRGNWMDQYSVQHDTQSWDPDRPVFVDVGGNRGYYCALFKKKFPDVPGRVILQDLPGMIEHALQIPGVETVCHDFFEEQKIKGSKYYHLGWVLHNWNDEKSRQILHQIKLAMTEESVLLINDMIVPDSKVPVVVASFDLLMMGIFGSRERTIKDWTDLLGSVGLLVKEIIVYDPEQCHGIISATLK